MAFVFLVWLLRIAAAAFTAWLFGRFGLNAIAAFGLGIMLTIMYDVMAARRRADEQHDEIIALLRRGPNEELQGAIRPSRYHLKGPQ